MACLTCGSALKRPLAIGLLVSWVGLGADQPPEPASLQLRLPHDYQVHQRATPAGGRIFLAGRLSPAADCSRIIEARFVGAGPDEAWRAVATLAAGETDFRAELNGPAGGWYRLEARATIEGAESAATAVAHVGIGEVFVVAGQSNSANHGEERQRTRTGLVAACADGEWRLADDPQPGASGDGGSFIPPFGDALAARFDVPVGIIAAGVGATSVREWLPRGTRFARPPTLTGRVTQLPTGEWESNGSLFDHLVKRMKDAGPDGFRAVLWHQGESDANQPDPARTLPGAEYAQFLGQLIRESRRLSGGNAPWFVAQASYHTPDDPGSADLRRAQQELWSSGVALAGPDTDALTGDFRDGSGRGVHFSGKGLREHAIRWAGKVGPWLEQQLASEPARGALTVPPQGAAASRLTLHGTENFVVEGRPAFLFLPEAGQRTQPQPWICYAPTLPPYPDEAERWMHEQFVAAGIAVAGLDVGEAYGSPRSQVLFDALYRELTKTRGFGDQPCLLGRSRGGLAMSNWASANPDRIAGLACIYPVFDLRSYPGLATAARAYGVTSAELETRLAEFNPIGRIEALAKAGVPAFLIHGDVDTVVPLGANSGEFVRRYRDTGVPSLVKLVVLEGQGHNMFEGFFRSQALVDFAIARARAGATR